MDNCQNRKLSVSSFFGGSVAVGITGEFQISVVVCCFLTTLFFDQTFKLKLFF